MILTASDVRTALRSLDPAELGPNNLRRLTELASLVADPPHRVRVSVVHERLFPGKVTATANRALSRLREALAGAAEEAGVDLRLCVTEAKKGGAAGRDLWFEGARPTGGLPVLEELDRQGDAVIQDVRGVAPDEPRVTLRRGPSGKPLVRMVISYAHEDAKAAGTFKAELETRLSISPAYEFDLWRDIEGIVAGERWDDAIRGAFGAADLGLLLMSPSFLASDYIADVELPIFVRGGARGIEGKRVVPFELKALDFGTMDLRGLGARQIVRGPWPQRPSSKRDGVAAEVVREIHEVLSRYARCDDPEPPPGPDGRGPAGRRRVDAGAMLSGDLAGLACELDGEGVPTSVGRKELDVAPAPTGGARVPALDYVLEWLGEPGAPDLFALLAEYGMGKTITCQRVVRAVEAANRDGAGLPVPLYFDLRKLTRLRSRSVPTLTEVIDECVGRGWRVGEDRPSAAELLKQARSEPVLFVFDGLDEALVHLTEVDGKTFTRELLRVREVQPTEGRTRVLISCRTHFFRTLGEQDAHLTGQDRGATVADDYRALVLSPLTEEQVRSYLAGAVDGLDADHALAVIRSVHDLTDLSGRPYTLSLIAELLPEIERRRSTGEPVRGVTLYGLMVERWLARDGGKHHIKPEDKKKLMRQMAAWTWARGERTLPASEFEDWFGDWLDSDRRLKRRYGAVHLDKLEENLRTATFLKREDDDAGGSGFRFAHTSMQEFFLSEYLWNAVLADQPDRWSFDRVSDEVWDFFAQHASVGATPGALETLTRWAREAMEPARQLVLAYTIRASRNGWPTPSLADGQFDGVNLEGQTLVGLDLRRTSWRDSRLCDTRWTRVNLRDARLVGADARYSIWSRVDLEGADFRSANLAQATLRRCDSINMEAPLASARVLPPDAVPRLREELDVSTAAWGLPRCVAFSPDGTKVLVAAGPVSVVDVATRDCLLVLSKGAGRGEFTCDWSPCGTKVIAGGQGGEVSLWQVPGGERRAVLNASAQWVLCCRFSPDGRSILTSGSKGEVSLWDVDSGGRIRTFARVASPVKSCAWSPDGRMVAATLPDGVTVWDSGTGDVISSQGLEGFSGRLRDCAWSPSGSLLAVLTGSALILLRTRSWTPMAFWSASLLSIMETCAWLPGGRIAVGESAAIEIIDPRDTASKTVISPVSSIYSLAVSPTSGDLVVAGLDGVELYENTGGRLGQLVPRGSVPTSCAAAPAAGHVLTFGGRCSPRVWAGDGELLRTPKAERIDCAAWERDGARLAYASGSIVYLDCPSVGTSVSVRAPDRVVALRWAGPGEVVACTQRGELHGSSGSVLQLALDPATPVRACSWSFDGSLMVLDLGNSRFALFNGQTGARLVEPLLHESGMTGAALSPCGERIASWGREGSLRLWRARNGELLDAVSAHSDWMKHVDWTADGRGLVSCGLDGALRFWRAAEALVQQDVTQVTEVGLIDCVWSPDETGVLTLASDGVVRSVTRTGAVLWSMVIRGSDHALFSGEFDHLLTSSEGAWRWLRSRRVRSDGWPTLGIVDAG